ncbi:helix-turn-helix transcriptional regulator [Microbacterium allomyrinae]|uniref:Helix-turn-helix domain-containing protein n=1 Tax=Microbacterium allomyrinae TaxID=2830666 RepID=A0A9X1LT78_9MICO|nr:helix-turn-helix transcriptional regulator [Microbacterium allomyrinae]MCC2031085.1 helix-turn-helix domain-containing protein [Microbacterium allomyrinae]
MEHQTEVSEFLRTRRERLTPEQVGIIGGGRRRVPGLRREEVAMLAGMSVDYVARMERGNLAGVSPELLGALARALRLDEAETAHLHDLARAAAPVSPRRKPRGSVAVVPPTLNRFLDAVTATPVWVRNTRMDYVAGNDLGRALFAPMLDDPASRGNNALWTFLSPAARLYYPDWEQGADSVVASLRSDAGRTPHDKGLTDLIGELVTRSDDFRQRWAKHDVRFHRVGTKRIHHPAVGDLEFDFEAFEMPGQPSLTMFAFTTRAGSPSEDRMRLLGSLAATSELQPER